MAFGMYYILWLSLELILPYVFAQQDPPLSAQATNTGATSSSGFSSFPISTSSTPASSAASSFLPLTTVFPVPTSCFDAIYQAIFASPTITAFRDYGAISSECYPESYQKFEFPTIHPGSSWYSPGVCPSGYPIASTSYDSEASATRAWCCPGPAIAEWVPEFPWGGTEGRQVCIRHITTSTSLVLAGGTTIVTDLFQAYDWPISVMWAESDLKKFTPMSAPLLANGADVVTSPTKLTSTSSSTSTPESIQTQAPPSGLSTGAKAGIGVGVAVLVIALLAGVFFVYRRRKARRVQPSADTVQTAPAAYYSPEKEIGHRPTVTEMDSNGGQSRPQELHGMSRAELEGNNAAAYRTYK